MGDASFFEGIAVGFLGKERFCAVEGGGFDDGLFEREVLKGVEGVVVDEYADGALGGEEVGCVEDGMR